MVLYIALLNVLDFCLPQEMARHATTFDPVSVEAEHTMFIMYTSGTTAGGANPTGIKHCTAGYLLYVALTHQVRICGRCIGMS